MTFNNIHVDNSTIGSINTGNVQTIDVNLTHLQDVGNQKAKEALTALRQAVIQDLTLQPVQKNEILEQIAFLTTQATIAPADRQRSIVRATLEMIGKTASTVTSIAGAWHAAKPILEAIFQTSS